MNWYVALAPCQYTCCAQLNILHVHDGLQRSSLVCMWSPNRGRQQISCLHFWQSKDICHVTRYPHYLAVMGILDSTHCCGHRPHGVNFVYLDQKIFIHCLKKMIRSFDRQNVKGFLEVKEPDDRLMPTERKTATDSVLTKYRRMILHQL